jgi:hypothetical protein
VTFGNNTFAQGTANIQVDVAVMTNPYGVIAYEADGINVTVDGRLKRAGVNDKPLNFLQLDTGAFEFAAVLTAWVNNTFDGSAADTGVFTTASDAVGANEGDNAYSLPANFGPGRGRWTALDVPRLNVLFTCTVLDGPGGGQAPVYAAPPAFYPRTLAGGNVRIAIKNISALSLIVLGVSFQYRWSGEE